MLASYKNTKMVDNIKFYFPANQFNGNFANCILIEEKKTRKEWRLYNPINRSHMSIWEHNNGAVTIKGSLRKWFFGNYSVNDLTLASFIDATKHLAEMLGLSWETLCAASATQIEFGFNVPISIPFSELSRKIVSYGTHRNKTVRGKCRTKGNYGTLYFGEHKSKNKSKEENEHDCDFRLKIYDKCKEIEDKRDFIDDTNSVSPIRDIMRIEFTADDKNTFKHKGLPQIANINGLIKNWGNLYELWATEVGRITILSNISDSEDFTLNDILCAEALNWYPWKDNISNFEKHITEHYKTKASINNAKSKLNRRINNFLDNYSNPDEYRKINFYKDIIRYFIEQKANGEHINLSRMVALLHSNTHYTSIEK